MLSSPCFVRDRGEPGGISKPPVAGGLEYYSIPEKPDSNISVFSVSPMCRGLGVRFVHAVYQSVARDPLYIMADLHSLLCKNVVCGLLNTEGNSCRATFFFYFDGPEHFTLLVKKRGLRDHLSCGDYSRRNGQTDISRILCVGLLARGWLHESRDARALIVSTLLRD